MSSTTLKLLTLLLDWVLDGQGFLSAARNEVKGAEQRVSPEVGLNERCLKVTFTQQLHSDLWIFIILFHPSVFF